MNYRFSYLAHGCLQVFDDLPVAMSLQWLAPYLCSLALVTQKRNSQMSTLHAVPANNEHIHELPFFVLGPWLFDDLPGQCHYNGSHRITSLRHIKAQLPE